MAALPAPSADRFCGGSLTCVSRMVATGNDRVAVVSDRFDISLVTNARDAVPRGNTGFQLDFRQLPC